MQCPSCKSYQLKPIKLQAGLPARECSKCRGILIDLLSYREWSEVYPQLKPPQNTEFDEVKDSSQALTCPKCEKLMLKFRISGDVKNKIDVCSNCDEAWLDRGEWQLLGSLSLQSNLTKVFTSPWQTNINNETHNRSHEERFKRLLNDQDYEKISDTKKWIDTHPSKSDLIRYLLKK